MINEIKNIVEKEILKNISEVDYFLFDNDKCIQITFESEKENKTLVINYSIEDGICEFELFDYTLEESNTFYNPTCFVELENLIKRLIA